MARKLEELESEVLQLELRERASVAKILLESLEALPQDEIEQLWATEADARYEDLLAGRTTAIDGDQVFEEVRSRKR